MSAYTAIASQTLGSSASSVTFSSIPGTFRDLVLVVNTRTTVADTIITGQVNGSAADLFNVDMIGNGSTATSSTANRIFFGYSNADWQLAVLQILDYQVTDKHKSMLLRSNSTSASPGVRANAIRWASTSAITSLTIVSGSQLEAGSTFSLYGVSA